MRSESFSSFCSPRRRPRSTLFPYPTLFRSPDLAADYGSFYRRHDPAHVYPVEFVVRAFLGSYTRLLRGPSSPGERVLDVGFGDGRNLPLLDHLGLAICGVEISADICAQTAARMARLGIP